MIFSLFLPSFVSPQEWNSAAVASAKALSSFSQGCSSFPPAADQVQWKRVGYAVSTTLAHKKYPPRMQQVLARFLSAFPLMRLKTVSSTRFAQVCSFESASPQSTIAFWPGRSVLLPWNALSRDGLAFSRVQLRQNGQLYVSWKPEPSKGFHIVLLPMESVSESGRAFALGFLLAWQSILRVRQRWRTARKPLTLCGDVIFPLGG